MAGTSRFRGFSVVVTLAALCSVAIPASAGPPPVQLTTATAPDHCGSVAPDGGWFKKNSMVQVTATAANGCGFAAWGGDAAGAETTTTVRMTGDKHVIALFTDPGEPPPPPPPPATDREVVGYFAQWGVYRRDYHVRNVVESDSARFLTVINYAFAGIGEDLECVLLDPFADYQKRYDADESVDGAADSADQPLKGNFNQLKKLKVSHPHIRVLAAVGGWNGSERFSDAALPEHRTAFVTSCIDLLIRGRIDPANGVVDDGIFDGIDIDWEYPGACGATCNFRPEDTPNFTALLAEFRGQLDAAGRALGKELLLTIAGPAGKEHYGKMQLDQIPQYLDWVNLMTYDFHGSWEPGGPANHHANLYPSRCDNPGEGLSADAVVAAYVAGGVPPEKLALGLPFYGRGWARVRDGGEAGLCQSAGRVPRGTWEKGVDDYEVLAGSDSSEYWDPAASASWLYDGNEFWTFESPGSIVAKMEYIATRRLRGVMFWELSGDDPGGTLIHAIAAGP